jgi:hypothetical protein
MASPDIDENVGTHPSLLRLHGRPRPISYTGAGDQATLQQTFESVEKSGQC